MEQEYNSRLSWYTVEQKQIEATPEKRLSQLTGILPFRKTKENRFSEKSKSWSTVNETFEIFAVDKFQSNAPRRRKYWWRNIDEFAFLHASLYTHTCNFCCEAKFVLEQEKKV